ncbi:GL20920 [Drosophila persimilis]|uniref:GL20920 n=1 Tax=Drosophila persimilis TaxID=7234 RepID=B4H948_DROPE|nr:GL20920 [Drosophila persimilis]
MNAGRKDQEQAQAAAAQSGLRPSRPPTFDQRMQAVEEGIEKLAEMIEDYKRCYRSTEPEPQAKTPKRKAANAPVNAPANAPASAPANAPASAPANAPASAPANAPANAPASAPANAPANTLGKKATNANGKEPQVKKPTSTKSMAPTSYQAMVQPKIEASLTMDLTPTIKAIEKMWQPKHQVQPKKIKLSSQSEAPLKIRLELEGSEDMAPPKTESVESTSTQTMALKKIIRKLPI